MEPPACGARSAAMLAEEFLGGLALPLPIVVARLVGAAALCAVIGLEREASDRAAGLRTHMLVGMAAAAFALITLHLIEMYADRPEVIRLDPIRLVEAATAGVAFLAAGMIVLSPRRGEEPDDRRRHVARRGDRPRRRPRPLADRGARGGARLPDPSLLGRLTH